MERDDEALQHATNFLGMTNDPCGFLLGHEFHSPAHFDLCLQFVVRSLRVPEMHILGRVMSAKTLGNVPRYGDSRLPYRMAKHKLMIAWESHRHAVTALCQIHRFLPDHKVTKRSNIRHAIAKAGILPFAIVLISGGPIAR